MVKSTNSEFSSGADHAVRFHWFFVSRYPEVLSTPPSCCGESPPPALLHFAETLFFVAGLEVLTFYL